MWVLLFFSKFHICTAITSIKRLIDINDQSAYTSVILFCKISYVPFRNELQIICILTVHRDTM